MAKAENLTKVSSNMFEYLILLCIFFPVTAGSSGTPNLVSIERVIR